MQCPHLPEALCQQAALPPQLWVQHHPEELLQPPAAGILYLATARCYGLQVCAGHLPAAQQITRGSRPEPLQASDSVVLQALLHTTCRSCVPEEVTWLPQY